MQALITALSRDCGAVVSAPEAGSLDHWVQGVRQQPQGAVEAVPVALPVLAAAPATQPQQRRGRLWPSPNRSTSRPLSASFLPLALPLTLSARMSDCIWPFFSIERSNLAASRASSASRATIQSASVRSSSRVSRFSLLRACEPYAQNAHTVCGDAWPAHSTRQARLLDL